MVGPPGLARRSTEAGTSCDTDGSRRPGRLGKGRPGAGLGIQFPVRSNLLWGLGELQAPRAARELTTYLSNMHGSALGGFHLPAMGALYKLGAPAVPELVRVASAGEEAGVNAVGVLEALGCRRELEALAAADGGRGLVPEGARAALDGADRPPSCPIC